MTPPLVFVDTSVWVASFRQKEHRTVDRLSTLLESGLVALPVVVRLEILSGCKASDVARVRRLLQALPVFYPTEATWEQIESWSIDASRRGTRFSVTDLVIAGLCAENNGLLWSLDRDFEKMAKFSWIKLNSF